MLILSRCENGKITVDGPVEITVCKIRRGQVRLGFTGPGRVVRNECKNWTTNHEPEPLPGSIAAEHIEREE